MISMDKKYTTRSGLPVRVICVDKTAGEDACTVVALIEKDGIEKPETYTAEGAYFSDEVCVEEHQLDLIEVLPYVDFKIDDPVMVRNHPASEWKKRHFAGVDEHSLPMIWSDGKTSFTSETGPARWNICRRPTPEEREAPK